MRVLLRPAAPVFLILALIIPLAAQAALADEAMNRAKYALRQATLVKSLTATTCFTLTGRFGTQLQGQAYELIDTVDTVLVGLRDGHDWMGLEPETNSARQDELRALKAEWAVVVAATRQIVHRDFQPIVMQQVLFKPDRFGDSATRLAIQYLRDLSGPGRDPRFAATVQAATHHSMLSQRALAEMCFAKHGVGGDKMRARLQLTMDEMDSVLAQLTEGSDTIAPFPNARVQRNYRTAMLFWNKMRPTLEAVVAGDAISDEDAKKVLKLNRSVRKQLDQGLDAYLLQP